MSWKTAVVASTPDELRLKLSTAKPQNSRKAPSLGFVFTGQGAQWPGMGRQLLDLPAFRHSLTLSSASLHSLGADWDVVDELTRETDSRVNEAAISQPLCTILQIALVDLLSSWAIKPTAVVGHSSGELAAGYASGLASRRDAIASAYHRGLVSQQSNNGHDCAGAMAAIQAPEETVLHLLGRIASSAAIACYNSPSLITVSGDATAIDELTALCEAEHISLRRLPVDVAYHSSRMRAVAVPYIEAMRACARTVNHPVQTCDMFSSVRGDKMPAVGRLVPEYWADNLTSPVRFSDALVAMCTQTRLGNKASIDCLVELGPHSTLASPIRQIIQGQSRLSGITYLSALKRGDNALETALALAGRLFEHGCPVDIEAVNGGCRTPRPAIIAAMPSYPWNHEVAYWAEPRASKQYRMRKWPRHDILGAPVHFSNALEPRWRNWIRCSELPWLRDHRVNGLMVYPAAGYVAMAVEGARQGALARNVEIKGYEIRDLRIGQALVIPEGTEEIETMMSMRPCTESSRTASTTWSEFIVYSADESDEGLWSENCRGLISVRGKTDMSEVSGAALADQKRENLKRKRGEMEMLCTASKASEAFYADFASIGVEYEGIFANVTSAKFGHGAAVSKVSYPDVETCMPMHHHSPFVIHPSFLDSAFQVAALGLSDGRSKVAAMVPTFISQVYISDGVAKTPGAEFSVYSKVDRVSLRDADMTIDIYDDAHDAQVSAVSLSGFTMTSLSGSLKAASETPTPQTCYTPQWTADPDLLQTEHLESLCSDLRAPGLDDETLRTLDEATFYMAEETMQKIPVAMLPSLSTKSQNLFQSIYEMVDKVHSGEFGAAAIEWTKSDRAAREAIWDKVKAAGDEGGLYLAFRENLHRIILGEVDSLSVVMKDDILGRYYAADVRMSTQYRQAAAYIDLLANKNPALKVLEVGAGTGGATIPILKTAGGRISSYDITDISTGFFEKLREKTGTWSHLIKFGKLNIEHDPEAQGYEPASYDVVVASNVLHATEKMERTLSHVKQLLKPGGKLVLVELMKDLRACTRIFGVFDGWWVGAGDGRTDSPLLNEEGWDALLKKTGFGGIDLKVWDLPDASVHQGTTIIASRQTEAENQDVRPVIVVVRADDVSSSHVQALQTALGLGSDDVVLASQISETGDRPAIVVAELSGSLLNSPSASDLQAVQKVVTKNQVLWVTQGAAFPSQNPNLALVSGLFATLRAELGGSLVHLDGDPEQSLDDPVLAATIARVYHHVQTRNDTGHESDHDFAFRHGTVMIRRLNKDSRFTEAVCSTLGHREPLTLPYVQPTVDGRSLKLKIKTPGLLDSIYFDDDETMLLPPKGDELDILVESTALNFRDIMMVSSHPTPSE